MSDNRNDSFGGIKVNDQDKVNINFICPLCHLLLLIPTQLLCCGTRLCKWCSNKGLSDSEPFICPFCKSNQPKREMVSDRGCEREMNSINVRCHSCSWNGSYKDYKEHLEHHHADFECSDCHQRFYAKNLFEEHRQEMCEYRCIPCGVPGCVESVKVSQMLTHRLSENHQNQLVKFIIQHIHKNHYSTNINNLTKKSNSIMNTTEDFTAVQNKIEAIAAQTDFVSNRCSQSRLEHDQSNSTCSRVISQTKETIEKFNESSSKMSECIQSLLEREKELIAINQSYSVSQHSLLDEKDTLTFSFSKTKDEIKLQFSTSTIFKTAPYGYLFALRVASTISNSNNEQRFLSIFISLCRGNYDAILTFPFPYDIYVCLYDQTGQKKHIISKIESNRHPLELARQTSEKNNEIDIIEFCRLNQLTKEESIYLKANVFYIGIFIDFMKTQSHPFNR